MDKALEDVWHQPGVMEDHEGHAWHEDSADLLEAFSAALCVVNSSLQLVTANAAARAILGDAESGLSSLINATTERNSASLQTQLARAVGAAQQTILVLRTPQTQLLIWTVRPLRTKRGNLSLISLLPLASAEAAVVPRLREIYRLSQAEAEIAAATASGMEVSQIAEIRGVSVYTLRAQIVSIKAKMGLSRLTEVATVVSRIHAATSWF